MIEVWIGLPSAEEPFCTESEALSYECSRPPICVARTSINPASDWSLKRFPSPASQRRAKGRCFVCTGARTIRDCHDTEPGTDSNVGRSESRGRYHRHRLIIHFNTS